MRKFKCSPFGEEVDLDDPKTYDYLGDDNVRRLDDVMFKEIGQALVYMDYFHPEHFPKEKQQEKYVKLAEFYPDKKGTEEGEREIELNNSGYNQRQRVNALIKAFAENRRNNWENPLWFKEQIFLIQDETENMC